ncbi:hypothetical protein HDV57DRAFT_177965 [Trichoderma longibrachiatum]|uniref:Uncharacterized protein n=1 Tax=Trichoderma longibrachiatum ATCC 18648 TaxID=983965 RepID=A0A2T4CAQ8_TRILO|nr:hypothetical protein M440DRAFT_1198361 [Trichoderma longibrachiatum ATCC 18648]
MHMQSACETVRSRRHGSGRLMGSSAAFRLSAAGQHLIAQPSRQEEDESRRDALWVPRISVALVHTRGLHGPALSSVKSFPSTRLAALHEALRAAACARWQRATLSRRSLKPAKGKMQNQLQLRYRLAPCSDPPRMLVTAHGPRGIILLFYSRGGFGHSSAGFCICKTRSSIDSCFSTCAYRRCLRACMPRVILALAEERASHCSEALLCRSASAGQIGSGST